MSEATRELARAVRRTAHDVSDRKPELQVAVVRRASPIQAELTENRQKLTEDDLLFGQGVRRYDRDTAIKVGDSLVVSPLRNGDWVVHEVLGEGDPKADIDTTEAAEKDAAARVKVEKEGREAAVKGEKEEREAAVKAAGEAGSSLLLARAATTAALATNTASGITLEATANGALAAQDGISLAVGDRLLVKNEGTGSKNGVYEVTSLGAAGSKWKLTRIPSMNSSAKVVPGMKVAAAQGTQNGGTTFSLLTTGAITLGTTALSFGLGTAWTNLSLSANWKAYETFGATPQFRKSPDGRVSLRGLVQPVATGQNAIATLPEGFWPSASGPNGVRGLACAGTPAGGAVQVVRMDVYPEGKILPEASFAGTTNNFYVFLDSINFYID